MASSYDIYTGEFVNTETTRPGNVNIQQLATIRIFDYETPSPWPAWGVTFRTVDNGDGTITAFVKWDPDLIPGDATDTAFGGYPGDMESMGLSGSATVILPDTVTVFYMTVTRPSVTLVSEALSLGDEFMLEMGETPMRRVHVDNNEDTFTPILSTRYELEVHTSNNIQLGNFVDGGDNRWYTEIEMQEEGIIFKGWLSIEDISENFMPHPNVLTLIATDGLGFLEDEPLVNFDEEVPQNEHRILDYILWCLRKTGLSLPLKANMNIRHENATPLVSDDSGDGHFFAFCYLDARTFEADIGECEDCYTVLEKILGEYCQLFQYRGQWLIKSVDEQNTDDRYFFSWEADGTFIEQTFEGYDKNVGVGLPLSFMNDDAIVRARRAYREIIERFDYASWREVVCNIDFSRGAVITPPDLSAAESSGTYEVECWIMRRISSSITSEGYIQRDFEYGYEKDRYLVITAATGAITTPYDFLQSSPLQVQEKAKIDFSVNFRWVDDFGDGEGTVVYYPAMIYMVDQNGDYWYWWNPDSSTDLSTFYWYFRPQGDGEGNFYMPVSINLDSTDESEWQTISASLDPLPASGELFICLLQLHQDQDSGDNQDAHFSNLSVTYNALINGNYAVYSGQQMSVTNEDSTVKAVRETEVFISDGPDRNYKGVLLRPVGDDAFGLTTGFYQANVYTDGDPDQEFIQPFGYWQAFAVWNQFRRTMRIFEATIDGTDSSDELPDVIHKYRLTDIDLNTTNGADQYRLFQILHADMDLHLCEWSVVLMEVFNTSDPKVFTGLEFKYITRND